ncbi:hypothetical protein [Pseudonocardia sp. WMMC193]|uniref:hypothetical protein n=1 Tax=Pseudonocardia sp. WMMC193 TaxID=2911965 RepID=UPI001F46B716|nr:hypothetical protein [Pseudonocardia sp. WMMC193]MCF7550988.1 hypothetical protein [Pseudonocardia sp. WMMC193]
MSGPTRYQHRRMHALWKVAQVQDRDDRLRLTSAIIGRPLATSNELTERDADRVIDYMAAVDDEGPGALAVKASRWLDQQRRDGR